MLTIDPLRERLAAPELAEARAVFERAGLPALIAFAHQRLAAAVRARLRFAALTRAFDEASDEAAREVVLDAYLVETAESPRELRRDRRARKKSRGAHVDPATLDDRVARTCAQAERAAEASLALARAALEGPPALPDLTQLFELARTDGRWSRRVEALGLLGDLARLGVHEEAREAIATVARALTTRTEHRWVQPAALAALATIDPSSALALARARLATPEAGDDFLVRERLLELAARGALGREGWVQLAPLAATDPSEHVRLTLARGERARERLLLLLREDPSPKVRATAAITLAAREPARAEPALVGALDDPHELPVRTAAEELTALARRRELADFEAATTALARAAERPTLPSTVRARLSDAVAELSVHADPQARDALELLAPVVSETAVGGRAIVESQVLCELDDARLSRVLAVLSLDDFALGVDRIPTGLVLHRGEPRRTAAWRVLHELAHPGPGKRQAFDHTSARTPRGALRAPPGRLSELTATRVPGERVRSERMGGWGRNLPLPEDLLSLGLLRRQDVSVVCSTGVTTLRAPKTFAGRLRAYFAVTTRYAQLAELRRRALEAEEPPTQQAYVREVALRTGIEVTFAPHASFAAHAPRKAQQLVPRVAALRPAPATARGSEVPSPPMAMAVALPAALSAQLRELPELLQELLQYGSSPHGNRLPHLAAYATVMLGAFLVRGVAIRRSIEHDRANIALVIGGWGTRGKSGTERLKAALFQGLGHECLVKTTGCEAMFIHAVPGQPAHEIFIYRPYDKATVWEQRDVLALARSLGVRVFLWECMALQPELVNLLQAQWMRDDYSTITNAYPDHEDVQGPSGYDVATAISEFVPTHGRLLTAEEEMLPIIRERARERGTTVRAVGAREAELLADDVLSRFPYAEHPRNVALVAQLARSLGISSTVALAEMADHVVPDLGVLKDYPAVPHRGRTLSFVNGMSANERTAALGNWVRTGFAAHDPAREPSTWVVTVVNNRADRVARSEVFARFIVEDLGAHRHVLIGTNVRGLRTFIDAALDRHLSAIAPGHELSGDGTERLRTARARLDKAFARLKIVGLGAADAARELASWSAASEEPAFGLSLPALEALLSPASPDERWEESRRAIERALPAEIGDEARPFVIELLARRRTARAVHAILSRDLGAQPLRVDAAFARAYRAIFEASLVCVEEPATTGDQLLDLVAASAPPGVHARMIGLQNIKGTGLDFVYRWVSIAAVHRQLAALESTVPERRADALHALSIHGDYGLLDARLALERVEAARAGDPRSELLPYDLALAQLRRVVDERAQKLTALRGRSWSERARSAVGKTFDYLDAVRRRRLANELLEALVERRISHAAAATTMREIVARAKGGWLRRSP